MANEGTINISLAWANGLKTAAAAANVQFDVTESVIASGIITVTTAAAQIDMENVVTPYAGFFWNHDATNYIEIGDWNGAAPIYTARLKAGMPAFIPLTLAATDIAVKANTASCSLQYLILGT